MENAAPRPGNGALVGRLHCTLLSLDYKLTPTRFSPSPDQPMSYVEASETSLRKTGQIKLRIREAMGGAGSGWMSRLLRSIRQFRRRVQAAR